MAKFRIACVIATSLVLAGCASMRDDKAAYVAPVSSTPVPITQDGAYMARVEQQARMRGINVTWVNPPTKHAKSVATR